MRWFPGLRLLVYARSIARSLSIIAMHTETLARLQTAAWEKQNVRKRGDTPTTTVSVLDIAEANKVWRQRQRENMTEDAEESEL